MKDFAVYLNIEKWLKSTADMDADVRGWYINLLLHEYDKDGLPDDVEKIAQLAGVRFSEYGRFQHVFEHVFKHKFEQCPDGKRRNPFMSQVVVERQTFKAKRELAAKFSVILRTFRKLYPGQTKYEPVLKKLITSDIDTKDKHVLEHLFKQVFEHPIDISIDIDNSISNSTTTTAQTSTDETAKTKTEGTAEAGQTGATTQTTAPKPQTTSNLIHSVADLKASLMQNKTDLDALKMAMRRMCGGGDDTHLMALVDTYTGLFRSKHGESGRYKDYYGYVYSCFTNNRKLPTVAGGQPNETQVYTPSKKYKDL